MKFVNQEQELRDLRKYVSRNLKEIYRNVKPVLGDLEKKLQVPYRNYSLNDLND
jgi:predicted metal-dependent hydrolase